MRTPSATTFTDLPSVDEYSALCVVRYRCSKRSVGEDRASVVDEEGVVARLVPADFETDSLVVRLDEAGFDRRALTVVAWLGVTYYLTGSAIAGTLSHIGALSPGSELILDSFRKLDTWDLGMRNGAILAATNDEPWQSTYTDDALDSPLNQHGLIVTRT